MKRLAAALIVLAFSTAAAAARDPAQEARIDRAVAAVDPSLVGPLHDANAAADRGDDAAAAKAYAKVHAGAPNVVDVTRRLCTAEARSGAWETGIRHCREALVAAPSAENHAALASALLASRPLGDPELLEAASEAQTAVQLAPNAVYAHTTACEVAAAGGDIDTLRSCSAKLRALAPSAATTHVFSALVLGHDREVDAAETELDAARAAGLTPALYSSTREALERARPKPHPVRDAATVVLVAWVALLFVVLIGGMLLGDALSRKSSRLTLALSRATLAAATLVYRATIGIAIVGAGAGLYVTVTTFLAFARLSRPIEGVLAVLALYLTVALARALFAKVPPAEIGVAVAAGKKSSLRKLVDRAASAVDMPRLDAVYARADATVEVIELGGALGHFFGKNRRVLAIGVAALEGLTQRQLAALVASELGRFRSGEAGGDLALVERAAFDASLERMEMRGVALDANPAFWFVKLFRGLFERISDGAIELQQERADRRAARAFDSAALAAGLRHLARREVEIDARARASVRAALDGADGFELYAHPIDEDVRQAIDESVEAMAERLERIEARAEDGRDDVVGDEPAWALFPDREALEREMQERVRRELERTGVSAADQPSSASSVARA